MKYSFFSLLTLLFLYRFDIVISSDWVACDNFITRDIPGGLDTVNTHAASHRFWMSNTTAHSTGKVIKWKYEFDKRLNNAHLPLCTHMHKFGRTYDEIKYFCSPGHKRKECNVYSLGSNNQWEFEEEIHRDTSKRVYIYKYNVFVL